MIWAYSTCNLAFAKMKLILIMCSLPKANVIPWSKHHVAGKLTSKMEIKAHENEKK